MILQRSFLFLILCILIEINGQQVNKGNAEDGHVCTEFEYGKPIPLQCRDYNGVWGPGPICKETGQPIQIPYGRDVFLYCALEVNSTEMFYFLRELVERQRDWTCRVPMAPDHEFYLPLSIPMWGVSEPDHLHITNHMNFVFHGEKGKVIGATIYPIRDRFQFVKVGAVITFHGPVKWFLAHSFKDYTPGSIIGAASGGNMGTVLIWCALTFAVTSIGFGVAFRYYLRPRILRSVLKND